MEAGRLSCGDARSNIPHMQLFHHLKQKFPDLRDNDVNESIQKYGLDRERCEEELSQRTQLHPGGYYGPWGRSSPATSRLTSPVRASTPSTPTTPLLATTSPGVLGSGEYLVYSPGAGGGVAPLFTSPPATSSPALHPSPAGSPVSYGWHPLVANGYRPVPRQPQDGSTRLGDFPLGSRDRSKSRSGTPIAPTSAPVVPNSYDPFSNESPERRRSADNHPETRFSPPPPPPRPAMDPPAGLAATATATTTTTTFATLTTTTATTTTTITTTNCTNLSPVDGGSSSSSSSSSSSGGGRRSTGRPPPARVQDQLARKQRLAVELSRQVEEKDRLETEVEVMVRELQAREQQRKLNADTNTMRIEEVQQENQRLQSECYEMENRILRLAPDFELESYTLTQPQSGYSEGAPPATQPPQLTRGSSGSSLGSELGTPNTPNTPHTPVYLPTRPAPPPPAPPPPPLTNHGYRQYQGQGGERVEEASHKWGCSKCTFINHPDMNMCEMCDFPRFTIGTGPPHRQAATTALSHHQGPCYCHHRHSYHLHNLQHSTGPPTGSPGAAALLQHTSSCSSLPLSQGKPPSLTNILKDKLSRFRDRRSDSV